MDGRCSVTECFYYLMLFSPGEWSQGLPSWRRTVLGTLTRVSTMLDLLFRSVFTMWNTSMMFCCWIISHTLQMAQKVPLRPPPFLNTERQVSPVLDPAGRGGERLPRQRQGKAAARASTRAACHGLSPTCAMNLL